MPFWFCAAWKLQTARVRVMSSLRALCWGVSADAEDSRGPSCIRTDSGIVPSSSRKPLWGQESSVLAVETWLRLWQEGTGQGGGDGAGDAGRPV